MWPAIVVATADGGAEGNVGVGRSLSTSAVMRSTDSRVGPWVRGRAGSTSAMTTRAVSTAARE